MSSFGICSPRFGLSPDPERGDAHLEPQRERPFWPFCVSAADAHRPLPKRCDLLRIFAETSQRLIRADFTFRFNNQHYQIEKEDAAATMPGSRITVERRLDHTQRFRWQDRYLKATPIALPPSPPPEPKPRTAPPKPKPSPNHPWKRRIFSETNPIRPHL